MQNRLAKIKSTYAEYPKTFWTLVMVTFIDQLGSFLLFPFFALYITKKFEVGMTQVGILLAVFSIFGFVGSFVGGALTDRLGRRGMIIFSLLTSAFSTLAMGFVNSLQAFYLIAAISGIFSNTGGPAYNAIVGDLLPEKKRATGFGILRVAFNVSAAIGPAIGGLLAARSYLALFVTDAIISTIVAFIVFFTIPETKPELKPGVEQESMGQSFKGYLAVFRDGAFVMFVLASILAWMVYMNFNTTLGVYLRDSHGIPETGYGALISMNAIMVVAFQFWITRKLEKFPSMLMMAAGTLLFSFGFAMYGFFDNYTWFIIAMVLVTIGEMITVPIANAEVINFAPENMRGRYNAMYGLAWSLPFMVGPYLAGLLMDNYNPDWLWYACGILGSIATINFLMLHRARNPQKVREPGEPEIPPAEQPA
jgi:MFS family permease